MKKLKTRLITLGSASLILLGACGGRDKAIKTGNTTTSSTPTIAKAEPITAKYGHNGRIVHSGNYHLEFKSHLGRKITHLDTKLHDRQEREITDAKLTVQAQIPDGSNQVLAVPYSIEEKHYVAKLLTTAMGDYQVILQADINGEKFNSQFSFKR